MSEASFEDSLAALERIVRDLEDGHIGLDEALARYEEGVALVRACQGQLAQAEQRILALTGLEADGKPALAPFAHEATARGNGGNGALKAKPAERKKRSSEY